MSEEILLNITPQETRVAIISDASLHEIYVERKSKRGLVGNIYAGKVARVLPGMQAAFIDIGLERTGFLHVSDVCMKALGRPGEKDDNIARLLQEGRQVVVQVVKDPIGTKGARLTMDISIPSRFLVYMPSASNIGVSQRIEQDEERLRLKTILRDLSRQAELNGGIIARTLAEGASDEELAKDMRFLKKLWQSVQDKLKTAKAGDLIHGDLPLHLKVLRDMVNADVMRVMVDSRETHKKMIEFVQRFVPEIEGHIELYKGERPVFDLHSIEEEIQRALERKVFLKSGGYLIIDQTEAMTTIDVNTGAFVGHRNLEETIFKTNLEATQVIARQLRLRNLGGIMIVDFIDMDSESHKQQVLAALQRALSKDRAKTTVSNVSRLGLVEMTRKRTSESLEHVLCEECPSCGGRGSVKTAETVTYEVFREITRHARLFDAEQFRVIASDRVVHRIEDEESDAVAELETFIGKPIHFQAEPLYPIEQFDVVMM